MLEKTRHKVLVFALLAGVVMAACPFGCSSCSDEVTCDVCASGFMLTSANLCGRCPGGCQTCHLEGTNSVCDTCITDYQLGNGRCFECHPVCQTCSEIPTNCESCVTGYNLVPVANTAYQFCIKDTSCLVPLCQKCVDGNPTVCETCLPDLSVYEGVCLACRFPCKNCNFNAPGFYTTVVYPYLATLTMNFNPMVIPSSLSSAVNFANPIDLHRNLLNGLFLLVTYVKNQKGVADAQILTQLTPFITVFTQNPSRTLQEWVPIAQTAYQNLVGEPLSVQGFIDLLMRTAENYITCTECMPSYYRNAASLVNPCPRCPSGCRTCTSSTSCQTCISGYSVSGAGTCAVCTRPCSQCQANAPTSCTACIAPYSLSGTTCIICDDPCLTCSGGTSTCVTCKSSYSHTANAGICFTCGQASCYECSSSNSATCLICKPGFGLSNGRCTLCPTNCLQCDDSGVCHTCRPGFSVSNGACSTCGTACKTCSTVGSSICEQCLAGFYLDTDGTCKRCLSLCSTCSNAFNCDTFADGLVLFNDLVITCGRGCKSCNSLSPEICEICKPRYFLSGSVCLRCEEGCLTCTSATVCTVCGPSYQFSAGDCLSCQGNCLTCDTSDTTICNSCKRGYTLNGNLCEKVCEEGCLECSESDNTICHKCKEHYALSSAGRCVRCLATCSGECDPADATQCINCLQGFYMQDNICLRCSDGCSTCPGNICSDCFPGYILSESSSGSLICQRRCPWLCDSCNPLTNACNTCSDGYVLTNGICLPDVSCSPSCEYCPPGSYESPAGTCTVCGTNCATCTAGGCQECFDGYYQNSGSCTPCDSTCSICIDGGICEVCASGYVFQIAQMTDSFENAEFSSKCTACDSNCLTCIYEPTVCTSCASGYRLKNTRCHGVYTLAFNVELDVLFSLFLTISAQQDFIEVLAMILSINPEDIILDQLTEGSSVVAGSVSTSSSGQASDFSDTVSTALDSAGSINGAPIIGASFSVQYNDADISQQENQEKEKINKVAIIVGVVVGVVGLGVVLAVGIYCWKKTHKVRSSEVQNDTTMNEIEPKIAVPHNNTQDALDINLD